jgi:6-phospho-beta-glucosidase
MKKGVKIVAIGGGSSYTPELVDGFLKRYETLPVRELWLVDIPEGEEKLRIVAEFANRMVKKAGVPMKIHTTLDRREALSRADFVITQLRVGQLQARVKDERIPLKHGLLGQETNGAGGLFKGMRTIPVILDICKDMEELCPEAWLINFTNPVGMVMEGVNRYSSFRKFIGLCNVPYGMHKAVADQLGRPMEEVKVTMGGLNHMVYVTKVEADGKDITEDVVSHWGEGGVVKNIKAVSWDNDFIKELGVLPCSYHRYYYMAKEYLEEALEKYEKHETRAELVEQVEKKLFELYQDPGLDEKPELLSQRGGAYYSDSACNLIHSIYNDKGDIQVVNTVNRGAIKNFSNHEIVEVSCRITKEGPVPVSGVELPWTVNGLLQQIKSFEIAGCRAAVTGSPQKALLALMINPLVGSQKKAKAVLYELLEAHKEYLPQFFGHKE